MNSGTFAEEVLVHERQCIAIPDEMNFDTAALLGCGVITGFGAVLRVGKVQPGERVAVVGIGGVGVNALQATHIAGAGEIHAIDTDNSKRELALAVGATAFCNPLESTPEGGYDAAFVAVGSARVIENAIRLIRPGDVLSSSACPAMLILSRSTCRISPVRQNRSSAQRWDRR